MSPVKFSLAFFLGVLSETLLVGLFIPLLTIAGYAQWKKVSRGRKINLVMAFATVFFGLTVIAHWILGVRSMMLAALYLPPGVTVDQFFLPPYSTDEITRRAIFEFQVMVGDLIMIYRLYHIYEKNILICVIPSVTTAGLFGLITTIYFVAVACGSTNQLRHVNTQADLDASNNWSRACFCINIFNCVFMSVVISHRLSKVHHGIAQSDVIKKDSIILRARRVLVESAALWTLFVLMSFISFLAKSNLRYTFLTMISPVVGICFCMIIVRLGSQAPEVRGDSWESSQRSRTLSASDSRFSKVSVALDRVNVDRDVYVSKSESAVVGFHALNQTPPPEKQSPVH